MSNMWGSGQTQFFFQLDPDTVLSAIEGLGIQTTGRCLPLNSMENRVYEIEIDEEFQHKLNLPNNSVIAKFYRPGRWTKEQILEEHSFLKELADLEIPVIEPLSFSNATLFHLDKVGIFYSLFRKQGGRPPDELNNEQAEILGRFVARIHNVGGSKKSTSRLSLDPQTYGINYLKYLIENNIIPSHIRDAYRSCVEFICHDFNQRPRPKYIRIHGDCHLGNVLYRPDSGPFFIDFDDFVMGPAVQDLWTLIPGRDRYAQALKEYFLQGYQSMRDFDFRELNLIEHLRAFRFIHFSCWIAKRWEDPAFKQNFPFFNSPHYWDGQLQDLREQVALIQSQSQEIF